MSISVSRESISKLMTELVDSFPMEGEGRASISDFGKLLFAEGQTSTATGGSSSSSAPVGTASAPSDGGKDGDSTGSGSDQDSSSSAPCVLLQLRIACSTASDCWGALLLLRQVVHPDRRQARVHRDQGRAASEAA